MHQAVSRRLRQLCCRTESTAQPRSSSGGRGSVAGREAPGFASSDFPFMPFSLQQNSAGILQIRTTLLIDQLSKMPDVPCGGVDEEDEANRAWYLRQDQNG
jgi:hypothetical protein